MTDGANYMYYVEMYVYYKCNTCSLIALNHKMFLLNVHKKVTITNIWEKGSINVLLNTEISPLVVEIQTFASLNVCEVIQCVEFFKSQLANHDGFYI